MIVSTALLRVCLSVRPRWLVLCSMWLRSPLFITPHHSSPPPTVFDIYALCSFCLFSIFNSVSLLRRQKHGAFLTGSDRSQPHRKKTLQTGSGPRLSGVGLSLTMHCVFLTGLWWGDSDLSVVWYLMFCPTFSLPSLLLISASCPTLPPPFLSV